MKVILLLALEGVEHDVVALFKQTQVPVFSKWAVAGYKLPQAPEAQTEDNWFGQHLQADDSLAFLSICPEAQALTLLEAVRQYNRTSRHAFPLHAVQLQMEALV